MQADLCEIILQPDDPRDYHEIILPPNRLQQNLYKVIVPLLVEPVRGSESSMCAWASCEARTRPSVQRTDANGRGIYGLAQRRNPEMPMPV